LIVFVSTPFFTQKAPFKTVIICRFSSRNARNDADTVKAFQNRKFPVFIGLDRYLPFYPNVVPAPTFSAASPCSYHRKVISHSDGHSVVKYKRLFAYPLTCLEWESVNAHPILKTFQHFKICPSMSSQRKGVKYSIFAKISQKIFIPQLVVSEKAKKAKVFENFFSNI